jgi:formamidopyrimidine-DNA glycosylase
VTWRFEDPRKFGHVLVLPIASAGALPAVLNYLPPEPLEDDFSPAYLFARCRGRTRPIKSLLVDQSLVAGLGNIYASEALFRARIRPTRKAGRLTRKEAAALTLATKQVLREAIAAGGTTIQDFRTPDGSAGRFQARLFVYGRTGEDCLVCRAAKIKRIVIAGRSTFYCPRCQCR